MINLRGRKHVRSGRNIRGFRSCKHATGISMGHLDRGKLARERERLAAREAQRVWLAEQWKNHFEFAAGPLRVLPPSARANVKKKRAKVKKAR